MFRDNQMETYDPRWSPSVLYRVKWGGGGGFEDGLDTWIT